MRLHYTKEKLGLSLLMIGAFAFTFLRIDEHNALLAARLQPIPLETPLDAYIPFMPSFIFAYLLYYPWLLLPVPILKQREDFYRALLAFVLMQVIAVGVYLMFPSRMLRPDTSGLAEGLTTSLIGWVYHTDRGWNVFPSLHVAHSSLVAMLYWVHCRKAFAFAALGAALIAASTVLIKQHYVIDIPAGVLLAWICLRVTARKPAAAHSYSDPAHAEPLVQGGARRPITSTTAGLR